MVTEFRSKLAGRESKLVVILIQKRAPLPLGEDLNAMDRAQSLCNKCDLPGKNLFVLSHTNLLYGCITRLEDEFRDMAANYYHNQAKKVKAHKDSLNKTSHQIFSKFNRLQLLFVRHEFKIAFYAELKQDPGLALKHYQQAYNHLTELRMLDAHLLEVKTVAGFINYKICRLSFQNNASDAISQFRRHINFFANLVGLPQLAFEHEAWMSKQFEILGDLFQEAIKSSLTPLITQHPGLYYQEASRHAVCRRQLCQALCIPTVKAAEMNADDRLYYPLPTESNEPTVGIDAAFATDSGLFAEESESSPHLPNHSLECSRSKRTAINTAVEFVRAQSPLLFKKQTFTADSPNLSGYHSPSQVPAADCLSATEKINGLEFYGQRPWRQGIQSIEPPNPTKEREGILSLQKEELKVDHSSFIIPLLEQTRLQYKRYKAERMKLYPCILMGSEYYDKQDYDKALSCYLSVINEYRSEKWWSLYTFTLKRIATCAYLIAQPTVFLSSCLELLGPNSLLPLCEKVQVQQAIFDFLKTGVPNLIMFSPELDHTIKTIEDGWKKQLDLLIQHTSNAHSDVAHNESVNENKVDIEKKPQNSTDSHFDEKYRISLDITRVNTCIQCKACFSQPAYTFGQPVQLAVFLRSFAPLPILVHHVTVTFSNKVECPSSSLNTPPSTINKPLIGNFSTHQTSQTWSSKFILDSKEKFKVILLCLNPDVLGNQIKRENCLTNDTNVVDSIHLCLSPPMVNCHEDIINELILCTVSWQWNTKSDYHPYVSGRKTIGHKHHNLKKQHDVLHDNVNTISNNNCGLWCKEVVLSVPERRMQKNPIKIESNGFIINHGFPNLPPDWDIIDSRIRTEMHHPSSGLEITMPENVCILANEISQIKLTIRNPTLSDCTKLNLTVRLIPREKDSTEFPDNASNTSTTVSTTTMITNPTVIDNYIIVGSSSELISHISAKNINSSQKPSSAYFTKKLDDIPSNQSISVTISLCCSSPSLVSNNNQTLSCYLTFSTKILPCEYPDYLLSLSDSLTTETTLVYNVINESVKLSNNMELSNINNHLVQNIMDQNAMVIQCTQNIETNITILSPFELDYKLLSLTFAIYTTLEMIMLYVSADFTVYVSVWFRNEANEISCGSDSHNTCIKNLIMQSSESCTECHMLLLTETMNSLETINLGSITVHWSRVSTRDHDDMKPYIATTKFTLPTIPVLSLPIQISAELPAYGVMLTPFPITFILSNKTIYPQEAVFQLESIHGFMFSGQQKLKLRLLPDSPHYLNYTLLPLMSGNLKLPRLHVMLERYATLTSNTQNDQPDIHIQLEENLLRQVPTHLIPSTDGLLESSEKNPTFNQEEIKNM
ncbi:trafficking protein particle complex subunit 11 [Schistosoma bovis]|uniref:Trafficking protein particle complex subunit 11 n=1 Tax=Schistosoma bovis TaxID=6184 RepID=A0A430QC30_SCHBO|nr:trafficking protein particle complex subunit 11 [Schistosoma bovis]